MMDNVVLEGAMEEYRLDAGASPGTVLFDVAAAFPSVSRRWTHMVLHRMGAPEWFRIVRALYSENKVVVRWAGISLGSFLPFMAGGEAGMSILGSAWAILYHPLSLP